MIRSSSSVVTATVTVSVALHVAALHAFSSDTPAQIEGGAAAVFEARLDNNFADLAVGVMTPTEPDVTQSEPIEEVPPQPVQTLANLAPLVRFAIDGRGGLRSVSVARSLGSKRVFRVMACRQLTNPHHSVLMPAMVPGSQKGGRDEKGTRCGVAIRRQIRDCPRNCMRRAIRQTTG